ncbi:MAG: PIN domain nuclease [Chloroflexi bacterium]|nr:PIN domain nuclease [Chloroflexota bacterium]
MVSHPNVRLLGAVALGGAGWGVGTLAATFWDAAPPSLGGLAGAGVGALLGILASPLLLLAPGRALLHGLQGAPPSRIVAAIIGLILGLVVAALLSVPLGDIPGWPGTWLPLALSLLLGAAGVLLLVSHEEDVAALAPRLGSHSMARVRGGGQVVLDTSAIIDGRIADISQTGFLGGALIVPRFVLDELRHIADSSDSTRRNRGRRGLEILNRLQKETDIPVHVLDVDRWNGMEVDAKLVMLAKSLGAPIVTTDYTLNRVAELQGVAVLNVNELANAVKSLVIPGEELQVRVIQEGKEQGQGVAFLDDGTMIVVENGRRYVGSTVDVAVTRVLQTAAGRLIFTQVKGR